MWESSGGVPQGRTSAEIAAAMDSVATEIRLADVYHKALKAGSIAPFYSLKNIHGDVVNPVDNLLEGPVLISFFRGTWCPYSVEELLALNAILPQVTERGATIVAVSPQQPRFNRALVAEYSLGFDVLTDVGCRLSTGFGVTYQLSLVIKRLYTYFGIDLEQYNGSAGWVLPATSRYVLDTSARVLCAHVDVDYGKRTDIRKTMAALP